MNVENFTPFAPAVFMGSKDRSSYTMTVAVKATLAIAPGATAEPVEEQAFVVGDTYADDSDPATSSLVEASDLAPMKLRADVLLLATAHRPQSSPNGSFSIGVRVGRLSKSLLVHGERRWEHGVLSSKILEGDPLPAVPVTYENAYGGPTHELNPVGRGHKNDDLPYIELTTDRKKQVGDKPQPGGFGPLSPNWSPRKEMIGTFKADYADTHWPGMPGDFDAAFYNSAPPDQQLEGYLQGDEQIGLENLHPEHPLLVTRLPGWRVICLRDETGGGSQLVPLVIDTLVIEPDAERLMLTWRGQFPVSEPDAPEIERLAFLVEPNSEPVGDPAHYATLVATLIADREAEFEPEQPPEEEPAEEAAVAPGGEQAEDDSERVAPETATILADIAELRQRAGLPAAPTPEVDTNTELPPLAPEVQAEYNKLVADAEDEIRQDKEEEAAKKWTREKVITAIAEQAPFDDADLRDLDLSGLDLSGADFRGARLDRVLFTRSNLTGAIFAGCSAPGSVLDTAILRDAHLEGADFLGASLVEVDAAGAILVETELGEATLDRANLKGAMAEGVQLADASLKDSTCAQADFAAANLAGAVATGSDWSEARLEGADATAADFTVAKLPKVQIAEAIFGQAKLVRAVLDGAVACDADFTEAHLTGASLLGADISGAWLSSATADNATFEGANCADLQLDAASAKLAVFKNAMVPAIRGSQQADLSGANFSGAQGSGAVFESCKLDGANFRCADLPEANFDHASLEKADLTAADLPGARLDYANCRGSIFAQANLFEANLGGANLTDTDFSRANLYGAEFMDANITGLSIRGANLQMTKLEQWAATHGR